MINNEMSKSTTIAETVGPRKDKPDELGGIYFSSSVKIYDPDTKEILVHKRGDD